MAIYNGRILMRKGNEADFDASKLMSGEWAVSLDKGIVRICLEAGKVIRMATYEAFEEDMKQVEAILLECQSIEEAVRRINTEVNNKLNACAEYVQQAKGYSEQAKQYRDEALQFRNEAESFAPEGYADLVEQVNENTVKVDTIIAKADLGIKETASGEEIHLTDSAEGKAVEFALYGKAKQNTTTGKNLLEHNVEDKVIGNVTYTTNADKSITANGRADTFASRSINVTLKAGKYILSGCPKGGTANSSYCQLLRKVTADGNVDIGYDTGNGLSFELTEETELILYTARIVTNYTASNITFYPMIRLASIIDDTYEPYTGGQPSPNPDYPQEIEVSGESYNLLENTATSQTMNGVEFVVNEDKSITANGTASANAVIEFKLEKAFDKDVIISGCPSNGSTSTYTITAKVDGAWGNFDVGNGFTIPKEKVINQINVAVYSGYTANNLTFYPMIRKASVKNDRYMPYGKGSVEVKSCGSNILGHLKLNKLITNSSGKVVVDSSNYWSTVVDVRKFDNVFISGDYSILNSNTLRIGLFTEYPKVDTVGTRLSISTNREVNVNEYNYMLLSFLRTDNGMTEENGKELMDSFMVNEGTTALPFEPYKETLSTIPTENGLAGIKVSSGGNYTDQNGQQWICDEVVKYADGSGAYIQRIGQLEFDDSTTFMDYNLSNGVFAFNYMQYTDFKVQSRVAMFDCLTRRNINDLKNRNIGYEKLNDGFIYINLFGRETTLSEVREYLVEHPIKMQSELATPITTPLTAEEIAEISTFYPVTNISNDFDCGMKVKYNCDSKNYIDNKIALLTTAMVNNI